MSTTGQEKVAEVMSRMQYSKSAKIARDIAPNRLVTPSLMVNRDLGGGFAYGRIGTVWGSKSAGKTAFCVQTAAIAQQEEGKTVAFVDVEGTFHSEWAARLGLDVDATIWLAPKTTEDVTNKTIDVIQAGVDIVIVDSVSSMVPANVFEDEEFQGYSSMNAMGMLARETNKMLPSVSAALGLHEAAVLLIAQSRSAKVSSMHWADKPTNGKALEFYSSQMLRINSTQSSAIEATVTAGGKTFKKPVGREIDYTVTFNKLGTPWGTGSYKFYFDGDFVGVDYYEETARLGVETDVVRKSGAWYYYEDEKWQGADNFAQWLRDNPDEFKELRNKVNELL